MPLYAELQIGAELIIYPMPVPRDKEHYKVNRMLEGSTVAVNGIAPLHLFNGELLYAKETGRIQRVEFFKSDAKGKEDFERTMNQLVGLMKSYPKEADDILSRATPDEVGKLTKAVQVRLLEMSESMPPERRHKINQAFAAIAAAEKSAEIIKEYATNPDGNLYDKLGEAMHDAGLLKKTEYQSGGFSFAEPKPMEDFSDETECRHKRTDYFIGTGIVCLDCKKKLRV